MRRRAFGCDEQQAGQREAAEAADDTTPLATLVAAGAVTVAGVAGAEAIGEATTAAGAVYDVAVLAVAAGSNGTISSATMLMILISGLMAGPAVSL